MHQRLSFLGAALVLAVASASPAGAQDAAAELTTETSPEHGAYVADAEGRALYMFEADQQGEGEQQAVSNCYDACAEAWPPLTSQGEPQAGEEIQADLMATTERRDGSMQVTYGGWPLYYYVQDQGPGQTTGHDVEGFGGEWYLVNPSGEIIGH